MFSPSTVSPVPGCDIKAAPDSSEGGKAPCYWKIFQAVARVCKLCYQSLKHDDQASPVHAKLTSLFCVNSAGLQGLVTALICVTWGGNGVTVTDQAMSIDKKTD